MAKAFCYQLNCPGKNYTKAILNAFRKCNSIVVGIKQKNKHIFCLPGAMQSCSMNQLNWCQPRPEGALWCILCALCLLPERHRENALKSLWTFFIQLSARHLSALSETKKCVHMFNLLPMWLETLIVWGCGTAILK